MHRHAPYLPVCLSCPVALTPTLMELNRLRRERNLPIVQRCVRVSMRSACALVLCVRVAPRVFTVFLPCTWRLRLLAYMQPCASCNSLSGTITFRSGRAHSLAPASSVATANLTCSATRRCW